MRYPRVFVVSGPSGVGKSSIIRAACARLPDVRESVSLTTRRRRAGEVHGQHYFFVTRAEFQARIDSGDFLEWARIYDEYYGTSLSHIREILATRTHAVLDLDTQGGAQIQKHCEGAVLVFIQPPNLQVLEQRLRGRGTESEETLAKRLAYATHEMSQAALYDYIVVNDDMERAVEDLLDIIHKEENANVPFVIKGHAEAGRGGPLADERAGQVQGLEERLVAAMSRQMRPEQLLRTLEAELRGKLGPQVNELLRERVAAIVRRDLEGIVRETYREFQGKPAPRPR
ncbi:MAG TPA: guanylate kinase [bacterium]|nr:guanylate kinase [bacterium]